MAKRRTSQTTKRQKRTQKRAKASAAPPPPDDPKKPKRESRAEGYFSVDEPVLAPDAAVVIEGFSKFRREQQAFLTAFLELRGDHSRAAAAAKVTRQTPYNWRKQNAAFDAAYIAAEEMAFAVLREEAKRRAIEGVRNLVTGAFGPITMRDPKDGKRKFLVRHTPSDRLLMSLLAARGPGSGGEKPPVVPADGLDADEQILRRFHAANMMSKAPAESIDLIIRDRPGVARELGLIP